MYPKTYLRGQSVVLGMGEQGEDLQNAQFDDQLGSLEIEGNCCWQFFTGPHFQGQKLILTPGTYESSTEISTIYKAASSIKMC